MGQFTIFKEDKFQNISTYSSKTILPLAFEDHPQLIEDPCICGIYFELSRSIMMPDSDIVAIAICSCLFPIYLKNGKLILIVDGENITLNKPAGDGPKRVSAHSYTEGVLYVISKDILKKICDASSIEIKLYSDELTAEITNTTAVITFAKLFYNEVYDCNMYKEVVVNALDSFSTGKEHEYLNKVVTKPHLEVAYDGSDYSSDNSGCMNSLVLLITATGGILGAVCSML